MTAWAKLDDRTFLALAVAAAAVCAALETLLAYQASPGLALGLPAGAVVVAAVAHRPLWGVYGAVLAVPVSHQFAVGPFPVTPSEGLLILGALFGGAQMALHRDEHKVKGHPALVAFTGLIVVALMGLLVADDTFSVMKISFFWLVFVVIALMVANAAANDAEWVLFSLVLSGGILGAIAIGSGSQQTLLDSGVAGQVATNRATASFTHPNTLAFYLVLTLAPAIALSARGPGWRRVITLASIGAITGGLMLTLARTGIVGGGVSLMVLAIWPQFRRIAVLLLAALVLFATFNASALNSGEVSIVRQRLSSVSSREAIGTNPRTVVWRGTPSIIADHPFLGIGENNFLIVSPRYGLFDAGGFQFDHAHNILLTIAAETGLIGLAFFAAFLVLVGRAAVRALRARGPTYAIALAVTAAIVGLLVASVGEYPPRTNSIMATIMIEVGILLCCERVARAARAAEPGPAV